MYCDFFNYRVLIWCPNGVVFVVMCFLVRSLEAIAAAAQGTANLAIAAHTFPRMVSTVMVSDVKFH